jgi:hypothetical protein
MGIFAGKGKLFENSPRIASGVGAAMLASFAEPRDTVILAKAGIQSLTIVFPWTSKVDSRLRGNAARKEFHIDKRRSAPGRR